MKTEVRDGGVVLTIGVGSDHGLTQDMRIDVVRDATDTPLVGGSCAIIRIDKRTTLCRVKLTLDQLPGAISHRAESVSRRSS